MQNLKSTFQISVALPSVVFQMRYISFLLQLAQQYIFCLYWQNIHYYIIIIL